MVVYGAGEIWGGRACSENLWILGREPKIDDEFMEKAKTVIAEKLPGYNFEKLAHYTHKGDSSPYDTAPDQ